jgi:hypothetical protein
MTSPDRPGRLAAAWIGPAVAIVLVAVSGQVFGLFGAVLAASATAAATLFSAAEIADTPLRRRGSVVLAVMAVIAIMAIFAWQGALPWWRVVPRSESSASDYRGRPVPQNEVSRLRGALLAGADLINLDLRGQSLAGVTAPGALFTGADLSDASLRGADLRGADLRNACLLRADLAGAQLAGARVDGARFDKPPTDPTIGIAALPGAQRSGGCR